MLFLTPFDIFILTLQDKSGEIDASELLVLLRDVMKRMGLVRKILLCVSDWLREAKRVNREPSFFK